MPTCEPSAKDSRRDGRKEGSISPLGTTASVELSCDTTAIERLCQSEVHIVAYVNGRQVGTVTDSRVVPAGEWAPLLLEEIYGSSNNERDLHAAGRARTQLVIAQGRSGWG